MSKIKMRCISCGKWFQSANAKEVTCPDCTQKARKEKLAQKNAPLSANRPAGATAQGSPGQVRQPAPPPRPKHVQSGTNSWLDKLDDVKVSQPEPPPARPKFPSPPVQRETRPGPGAGPMRGTSGPGGPSRDERGPVRGPGVYRFGGNGNAALSPTAPGQRPRPPYDGGGRGPGRPGGPGAGAGPKGAPRGKMKPRGQKPPAPPKPKREKTPPPAPFVPTPEQIQQIEDRYLELAQPTEFDGIRTQIAHELSIPKKAIKKVVKDLRARSNIPSWWETQVYKGSEEELEKIKAAYLPHLPIPPVGVHKIIAEQLGLKPGTIYQAIKTVRQELNLPQFNDPSLHEQELAERASKRQSAKTDQASAPESTPETEGEQVEQVQAEIQHTNSTEAAVVTAVNEESGQSPTEEPATSGE